MQDIDFEAGTANIVASKVRDAQTIPLSDTALDVLSRAGVGKTDRIFATALRTRWENCLG